MNRYRVVKADDHFYAQRLSLIGWGSISHIGHVWYDDWKYNPGSTGPPPPPDAVRRLIKYVSKKPRVRYGKPKSLEVVTQFKNKKAILAFAKEWSGEW